MKTAILMDHTFLMLTSMKIVTVSCVCYLVSTLNSGEWFAPLCCNPLCCNVVSSPTNISLYKNENKAILPSDDGWYKCCLYMFKKNLKVNSEKDGISWDIIQLQVTDWPQDGVVREPRTVLQVIDDVIHRQQKIGGGPVVVHCR